MLVYTDQAQFFSHGFSEVSWKYFHPTSWEVLICKKRTCFAGHIHKNQYNFNTILWFLFKSGGIKHYTLCYISTKYLVDSSHIFIIWSIFLTPTQAWNPTFSDFDEFLYTNITQCHFLKYEFFSQSENGFWRYSEFNF